MDKVSYLWLSVNKWLLRVDYFDMLACLKADPVEYSLVIVCFKKIVYS